MQTKNDQATFIFRNYVNSFSYLYEDACYLLEFAKKIETSSTVETGRLCRSSLLIFVFCLEALINRALDFFSPTHLREFLLNRENRFRIEDKWLLLPLLVTKKNTFDVSKYPWSHFLELISIRNDYVHPKHNRLAYYKAVSSHEWTTLLPESIPSDSGIKEKDTVYCQTKIPKGPGAIRPEHIDIVKKIVDDTVKELDRLLGGKISQNNWLYTDEMKLIYPPNATLNDLAKLDKK